MKRLFFLFAVVILAVSVSCERDSGSSSDVAVSISPNTLTVPSAGGTFSIKYLVDGNQNVELEPVCGETWIGGWDFSVDSVLTFQVDTNRGGARTAVVHLVSDRLAEDVFFTVEQGDASKVYMYDDSKDMQVRQRGDYIPGSESRGSVRTLELVYHGWRVCGPVCA